MPLQLDPIARRHLGSAIDSLADDFRGLYSHETIARFVDESLESLFADARIADYVPVLAYRFTKERLTALAQAEGDVPKQVPEVVFVCVRNAGRSQLAAALLTHHGRGAVHVRSAGSDPADAVNPAVLEVLAELGIDTSIEFPKPLTDEVVRAADVVVTMGCGDACPVYPGKHYEDWKIDDPEGKSLEEVRQIRDDIEARVRTLLTELEPVTEPARMGS